MKLTIIAATGRKGEIGINGKLPWKSPSDLKRFKEITQGSTLIMGRKTFDSLPKMLEGRVHIVVTSSSLEDFASERKNIHENIMNVHVAKNLDEAIELAKELDNKMFLIGGGQLFREAIGIADELYITTMQWEGNANVFFPKFDSNDFNVISSHKRWPTKEDRIAWQQIRYSRKY